MARSKSSMSPIRSVSRAALAYRAASSRSRSIRLAEVLEVRLLAQELVLEVGNFSRKGFHAVLRGRLGRGCGMRAPLLVRTCRPGAFPPGRSAPLRRPLIGLFSSTSSPPVQKSFPKGNRSLRIRSSFFPPGPAFKHTCQEGPADGDGARGTGLLATVAPDAGRVQVARDAAAPGGVCPAQRFRLRGARFDALAAARAFFSVDDRFRDSQALGEREEERGHVLPQGPGPHLQVLAYELFHGVAEQLDPLLAGHSPGRPLPPCG